MMLKKQLLKLVILKKFATLKQRFRVSNEGLNPQKRKKCGPLSLVSDLASPD